MKKILLASAIALFASQASFAAMEPWQQERDRWQAQVKEMSQVALVANWVQQLTAGSMVCGFDMGLIVSSLAADTVPVGNVLAEIAANMSDKDYQSLESQTWYGQIYEAVTGGVGGWAYVTKDSLQFVLLALSGEPERGFESTKKAYESTIVLAQKLTADKSLCARMSRTEMIIRQELFVRWGISKAPEDLPYLQTPGLLLP